MTDRVVRVPGGAVTSLAQAAQGLLPGGRWSAESISVGLQTDPNGNGVPVALNSEQARAAQDAPVPWALVAGGAVSAPWAAGTLVVLEVESGVDVQAPAAQYSYALSTVGHAVVVATVVARSVRVRVVRLVPPSSAASLAASASVWAACAPWEWRMT